MTDYAELAALGVATVHEAAGRTGIVDLPLIRVVPGSSAAGPARTALCAPGDNTMVHALVAHARPGDVLVLTSAEPAPVAFVGDLLATQARAQGVAAMLVDGAVRDLDELADLGLPIWTRFVRAQGATKGEIGELDVPVVVGGVEIRPGDLVVMDGDGAVV
ncbi:MAG TPA: 4-carboxy-4-hydroxy-2-oxoadipate aldolase/oxaloacetate decarboxylase, partial [Gaiella sp.]|nr:4-carboxy-4-hydroxy-2-oxoadipate aldolase/oxaloacetate decarboxylase [Gaiella sp.]